MNYLCPSILAADFWELGRQVETVEKAGAPYLHIDIMDGMFVPSISFGMPVLQCVRKRSKLFMDVHMMVAEPERYIEELIRLGADGITIHVEACDRIPETLGRIRELGVKTGLAINPETPVSAVLPYMELVDMVLVMTVEPGFGGQAFMESQLETIRHVRAIIEKYNPACELEVDGGVAPNTAPLVIEAGANVLVAGSAVYGAADIPGAIAALRA